MEAGALLQTIKGWLLTVGYKLVIAVLILIFGFKIVNALGKKASTLLNSKVKMDQTILKTIEYAATIVIKGFIVLFLISYLGIETAGISAILASAGIGIGLALNGTLSNLSGGVMLLITRPFSIGDYISAQGQEGTVQDIHISYTRILTNDKKNVYLPNSALSSGTIVNYTSEPIRRVNFDFSIDTYDPEMVRQILMKCMKDNPLILSDPEPKVRVEEFGEGKGTKLFTIAFCKSKDYWEVYYSLLESVNSAYREHGLLVPKDKLEVHLKQD